MNRYFLIAVIVGLATSADAAENKPRKKRATRDEVSAVLRLLPARRSGDPQEARYYLSESARNELRQRVAELGDKTDIVPTVAARLMTLDLSTEENEAELTNLVSIMEIQPDDRALAALDRVASLKSPRRVRLRDGMSFMPYDYAEKAKKLAQEIRITLATESWRRELAGLPEAERVERLARYVWGIDKNTDEIRRMASADLLREIDSDIWWPRLVAQLPDLNAQDEVNLRKLQWMPAWIGFGIHKGHSHPSVNDFIQQAATSQQLEDWANSELRKKKK